MTSISFCGMAAVPPLSQQLGPARANSCVASARGAFSLQACLQDSLEAPPRLIAIALGQQVQHVGVDQPLEELLPPRLSEARVSQNARAYFRHPQGQLRVFRPEQPLQLAPHSLRQR